MTVHHGQRIRNERFELIEALVGSHRLVIGGMIKYGISLVFRSQLAKQTRNEVLGERRIKSSFVDGVVNTVEAWLNEPNSNRPKE